MTGTRNRRRLLCVWSDEFAFLIIDYVLTDHCLKRFGSPAITIQWLAHFCSRAWLSAARLATSNPHTVLAEGVDTHIKLCFGLIHSAILVDKIIITWLIRLYLPTHYSLTIPRVFLVALLFYAAFLDWWQIAHIALVLFNFINLFLALWLQIIVLFIQQYTTKTSEASALKP